MPSVLKNVIYVTMATSQSRPPRRGNVFYKFNGTIGLENYPRPMISVGYICSCLREKFDSSQGYHPNSNSFIGKFEAVFSMVSVNEECPVDKKKQSRKSSSHLPFEEAVSPD